jgi:hypothetical protein
MSEQAWKDRIKGLTLLVMTAAWAVTPIDGQAAAWRVEGTAYGNIEVEEIGYTGEILLIYSAVVKEADLARALASDDWYVLEGAGVRAWESINGGPLTLLGPASDSGPMVELSLFEVDCLPSRGGCNFGDGPYGFLDPVGTLNYFSEGNLSWWKDPYSGSNFWFEFAGEFYKCYYESYCAGEKIAWTGGVGFEGTVVRVPEPSAFALLAFGLCGVWRSRRRTLTEPGFGTAGGVHQSV